MKTTGWRGLSTLGLAAFSMAAVAQAAAAKPDTNAFNQVPELRLAAADTADKPETTATKHETRIVESSGGAEDEMEDIQSFNTWTSLEDGQPGQPGEVQINYFNGWTTTSGESDPWLMTPQLEITLGQSQSSFLRNTKIGIATPLELGNGGVDGNGDIELEWIQRWIAEEPCHWWPTFSTVNVIRFPSGYHSEKIDWTLTGVLAKNVGPGTAYMNAFLKSANGNNNLDSGSNSLNSLFGEEDGDDLRNFQWGFRWGYKWRINDKFALIADYIIESSELRGNHDHNIGELSAEWRVTDHLTIGPGILFGLDGAGETPNFGAGVTIHYEFFPFKCGA
jgi:hypothetical protein